MADKREHRERIRKLLRIAENQRGRPEGDNAMRHAERLMRQHGFTMADFTDAAGREKTEFDKVVVDLTGVIFDVFTGRE